MRSVRSPGSARSRRLQRALDALDEEVAVDLVAPARQDAARRSGSCG
jgi:hypothetical protein